MKATIKDGAWIGQDMQYHSWHGDTVFDVLDFDNTRKKCVAPGYGILKPGEYGNGAIYVKIGDLVILPDTPAQEKRDKYEKFFVSVSCLFVEGVEVANKIQLYDAIKKEWQKCLLDEL